MHSVMIHFTMKNALFANISSIYHSKCLLLSTGIEWKSVLLSFLCQRFFISSDFGQLFISFFSFFFFIFLFLFLCHCCLVYALRCTFFNLRLISLFGEQFSFILFHYLLSRNDRFLVFKNERKKSHVPNNNVLWINCFCTRKKKY